MTGRRQNLALASTLREAVGPDVDLMIDAWMSWDVPYTLRMARDLEEVAPRWIEEPVMPDKPESYAEITRRIGNSIAVPAPSTSTPAGASPAHAGAGDAHLPARHVLGGRYH